MKDTLNKLQFEEIKNEVKKRAIGNHSKERIDEMTIQTNLQTVRTRQTETKEARLILTPSELIEYADFLRSSRLITKFFEKNCYQTPLLYAYSKNMPNLVEIEELIYQQIKNQKVSDDASRQLRKVRKQLQVTEKEIQDRLLKFLRHPANKEMIQETMIVQKGFQSRQVTKTRYLEVSSSNPTKEQLYLLNRQLLKKQVGTTNC